MLLIKYDSNYADEFDISGFRVMTEDKWEVIKANAKKAFDTRDPIDELEKQYRPNTQFKELEIYFGTNEFMVYEEYEDWLGDFTTTTLKEREVEMLKKHFGQRFADESGCAGDGFFLLPDSDG